jgi:creatinine amidohydrolase/Fe(II)-dependent formamide hydrolase-like protein
MLVPIWDYSPTWFSLFETKDYHAAMAETSLLLHWSPEVVRKDKVALDSFEIAERLRQDPDSYQLRESFTDNPHEIVQTGQREDVKLGVMGYPEEASAEIGRRIEEEFVKNAGDALLKALAEADAARKSGKRIVHDNGEHLKIRSV